MGGCYGERMRRPKRFAVEEPIHAGQETGTARTDEALKTAPTTVAAAMARPDANLWPDILWDELPSPTDSNGWELVNLPMGSKLTVSRCVFDPKRDAVGKLIRYKVRFVVFSFFWRPVV